MKTALLRLMAFVSMIAMMMSCEKSTYYTTSSNSNDNSTATTRKIEFQLYTVQDFSNDDHNIVFNPFIKDSANKLIWDTILPAMKVKDIPDMAHKLVINKTIAGNNSLLRLGFNYSLENVGYSWYLDSAKAGETLKTVEFRFK